MPDLIAVLLLLLMTQFSSQLGTQASIAPPVVMEFYRDYLKPDAKEQYLRIETEVAQKYGAMHPHPYVTLKSLSGLPRSGFSMDSARRLTLARAVPQ